MHDEHVNVTPLIDVVMCLIIFFMICGKLAKDEANDTVKIPTASLGQELADQRDRLIINVVHAPGSEHEGRIDASVEPEIYVRGEQVSQAALADYLDREKRDAPDIKVILRADRGLAYDWIAPILISCAQANIKSVNFSTKPD
ncbi:MAG TPA: biopolymer transporter ExbD [Phycisphaerae bacterium]|nr:biopolymer transporter ExbD [Phycisphaerae bacterium]